jgi:Ca2+:H+ antiporter
MGRFWHNYWDLVVGIVALGGAVVAHFLHFSLLTTLLGAVAIGALAVTTSEIAEILSERLKEPYGSLTLTFSAVAVEIIILFMILQEAHTHPEVVDSVRNGIIATVLVDLNVLLGLAVFLGGLNYSEQEHNEDTSESYTTILFVASAMLLVPTTLQFTSNSESVKSATIIIGFLLFLYYLVIFRFQTRTHIHFFRFNKKGKQRKRQPEEIEEVGYLFDRFSTSLNGVVLLLLLGLIAVASELFSTDGVPIFKEFGIGEGLVGLFIAFITVAPELFTAIKAARKDEMQRVVNIAMGASTVSIMLTVPAIVLLSLLEGVEFTLVFHPLQVGALILTVILVWKTTENGETNYLEGISHIMLFLSYAVVAAHSP